MPLGGPPMRSSVVMIRTGPDVSYRCIRTRQIGTLARKCLVLQCSSVFFSGSDGSNECKGEPKCNCDGHVEWSFITVGARSFSRFRRNEDAHE